MLVVAVLFPPLHGADRWWSSVPGYPSSTKLAAGSGSAPGCAPQACRPPFAPGRDAQAATCHDIGALASRRHSHPWRGPKTDHNPRGVTAMTAHHRRTPTDGRTPTDRPPAVPPGPGEHDAAQKPGPPDVKSVVRGSGGEAAERDRPPIAGVRAWCPRPATPQELDDARTVLVVHRLDPGTGRCAACAADCPCPPALDAGRILAEAGAWKTVPFTGPTGLRVDPGQAAVEGGWVARLFRRLPWVAAAR